MKTKLLGSAIFAAILPATALASVATEQAFERIHQPLSTKISHEEQHIDNHQVRNTLGRNTLGQSYAMTQAFYHISHETDHATEHPVNDDQASPIDKPIDW